MLATRPEPVPNEKRSKFAPEAFGFADGMSQPVIRGTKRWMREADKIHTVEPGEFLLGYPDNRGFVPPSPTIRATADPTNILTGDLSASFGCGPSAGFLGEWRECRSRFRT